VLELLGIGAVAFGVGLSGALSPGPLTILAIREGARRGVWAGPLATAGHGAVELTVVVLLALGLAAYVDRDSPATAVIALAGGAILLWMAWGLFRSLPSARLPAGGAAAPGEAARRGLTLEAARGVVPLGALVSVVNPYWWVWWATVGTKLTSDSLSAGWAGPGAVFAGHIVSDLAWLTFLAFAAGSGARWLGDRGYRALLAVCAIFLLALGLFFGTTGLARIV
jgi:threonine/homoserine/homoserine lactone efflux protein